MTDNSVKVTANITDEEVKWVRMLCEGEKLSKIALACGVNKNTLAYKLGNLRDKLECKNTVQLAAFFFRNKLIQ